MKLRFELSEKKCAGFARYRTCSFPLAAALFHGSASAPDSDDDNLPIAQFTKKHKKNVARVESDSEDDTLLTDLMKVRARNRQKNNRVCRSISFLPA